MFIKIIHVFFSFLFAMMSDQEHTLDDYVELASPYESVCFIYDHLNSVAMTGVLIAPDIVVTCAHGIKKNGSYTLNFYKNKKITVSSSVALVDERYKELGSKFDIALLRLNRPLLEITPAKMVSKLQITLPLTVVTYANNQKRAFYLYELDKFGDAASLLNERPLHLSSLFFHPENIFSSSTDEMKIRNKEAVENWKKHDKGPYALALPGTSGGPVFVMYQGEPILLGVVTSYSTLEGKVEEPSSVYEAMGRYQTIFIPFYLQTDQYDLLTAWYKIDKEFLDLIQHCPKAPKRNIFMDFYENYIRPFFSRHRIPAAS